MQEYFYKYLNGLNIKKNTYLDYLSNQLTEKEKFEIEKFFLSYIFDKLDINYKNIAKNKDLEEELINWDRTNLSNLAFTIDNIYTKDKTQFQKLQYIIKHSIDGTFIDRINGLYYKDDEISYYNKIVLKNFKKLNINLENWINYGKNLVITPSLLPDEDFTLSMKQWKRDFRKEYDIGNISECCISVGRDSNSRIGYKRILLDYFLDSSIQVVHINYNNENIGQTYFVGFKLLNYKEGYKVKKGSCLGITATEIKKEYRNNLKLVPGLANLIFGTFGLQERYNFNSVLIGDRFSMMRTYLKEKNNEIHNLIKTVLNQRKQNYNTEIRNLKREQKDYTKFEKKICDIKAEKELLNNMLLGIYKPTKVTIEKIGMKEVLEKNINFKGTDYLDILAKKRHDGFYNVDQIKHSVSAYLINSDHYFEKLETTIYNIKKKYIKRFN